MKLTITYDSQFRLIRSVLTLYIIMASSSLGFGQPTITKDWFYTIGDSVIMASYSSSPAIEIEEGVGIIWDFSSLEGSIDSFQRDFVSLEQTPYGDEFPNANIALNTNVLFGTTRYYEKTDSLLHILGYRSEWEKIEVIEGKRAISSNSFDYGDIIVNTHIIRDTDIQDMVSNDYQFTDSLSYAGFGTVITPKGIYENCVLTKLIRRGGISGPVDWIEYFFHKDKLSNIVAVYEINPNGSNDQLSYTLSKINTSSTVIIEETPQFKLLQNNNMLYLHSDKTAKVKIQVFNNGGQLIDRKQIDLLAGSNELDLNIENKVGFYHILVFDMDTREFRTFKIVR